MESADLLLPVFLESFRAATLLPYSETILPASQAFTGTTAWQLLLAAMAGAAPGGMTSWLLGRLLAWLRRRRPEFLSDEIYGYGVSATRYMGWLAVPFYWVLFGGALPFLAGFFGMRAWQVALCLAAGRLLQHFHGY